MAHIKKIMVQGTASSSGKSLLTAALCRIFHQDGFSVAPFKAQNMSNNSYVTHDGLEMGRAQVVQAYAAGLEPDVRMNPVLLKPSSETGAQVVLCGKPSFLMNAHEWHRTREMLRDTIKKCYESLSSKYDVLVIEGAGSPAEINLKKNDIVNMGMARMADAPVVIVGDIDRGGVFASLVGTVCLLDPDERERVKGFIINKFRGDVTLLKPGLDQLEEITGIPVLGVVPWIHHSIDEEDGVSHRFEQSSHGKTDVDICVIRLPHISNYTDFIPLECIPGVTLRWCDREDAIGAPDLLVIPGTKATVADLKVLESSGIADAIIRYTTTGGTVFGICGGFQMLGKEIFDPCHTESNCDKANGLGLLDMTTIFSPEKKTARTTAKINNQCSWLFGNCPDVDIQGYEIHMGQSRFGIDSVPFTYNSQSSIGESCVNGIADGTGRILGTYLHGFFDSAEVSLLVINALRHRKGLEPLHCGTVERRIALIRDIDMLAEVVRKSIDMNAVYRICGF